MLLQSKKLPFGYFLSKVTFWPVVRRCPSSSYLSLEQVAGSCGYESPAAPWRKLWQAGVARCGGGRRTFPRGAPRVLIWDVWA